MNLYFDILITFFKIGLVSFGGGYAMIPVIQREVDIHRWLDMGQFTDIIALSAMAPGPVAVNSATIVGYKLDGIWGAAIASIGVILPSLLLILIIGQLFFKLQEHPKVKAAFYGLRPTIVGIIAYAAVKFAEGNEVIGGAGFVDIKSLFITVAAFVLLLKTKAHPVYLIAAAGAAGILIFR